MLPPEVWVLELVLVAEKELDCPQRPQNEQSDKQEVKDDDFTIWILVFDLCTSERTDVNH